MSWWKVCVCYYDVFSLSCVYFDQLYFYVVYVDGIGYVNVCESYVVLHQCDESPSLSMFSVCAAYGGVGGIFGVGLYVSSGQDFSRRPPLL